MGRKKKRKKRVKVTYSELDELLWDLSKYYDLPDKVFIPNIEFNPAKRDPNTSSRIMSNMAQSPCEIVYFTSEAIHSERSVDKSGGSYPSDKILQPKSVYGIYLLHKNKWEKVTKKKLLHPNNGEFRKQFVMQLIKETELRNGPLDVYLFSKKEK